MVEAQVQAMAVPANASDLTFQRWIKSPLDMELPSGGTHAQFRDPTQAWTVNGTYYSVVGTQVACIGSASLYASPDLISWSHQGVLASQVTCWTERCHAQGHCPVKEYSVPEDHVSKLLCLPDS